MLGKTRVPGWNWIFQRVTAVLLILGLGIHFMVLHFIKIGDTVMKAPDSTMMRFVGNPRFWILFDAGLLALALYHGLNGMYNIINDYAPTPCTRKVLVWALWLVGAGAFVLGIVLLGMFLGISNRQG
jgi:succinate dehydrogenase / fumarate reductase membrane anchor subunit